MPRQLMPVDQQLQPMESEPRPVLARLGAPAAGSLDTLRTLNSINSIDTIDSVATLERPADRRLSGRRVRWSSVEPDPSAKSRRTPGLVSSPADRILAMSRLQLLPNGYSQITIRRGFHRSAAGGIRSGQPVALAPASSGVVRPTAFLKEQRGG